MALVRQAARAALTAAQQAGVSSPYRVLEVLSPATPAAREVSTPPTTVFMGPPGVGKGTYSSRVADALGLRHIAAGDLVRAEIKSQSAIGFQMAQLVNRGELLPDSLVLEMVQKRMEQGKERGEAGLLLDGFPRTRIQGDALMRFADIHLVVNLHLRDEVLVKKCLGRRICRQCGENFNIADIDITANGEGPAIRMPPLDPPPACKAFLEVRSDDNYQTIKRRLEVYHGEAKPVEDLFREAGLLIDFEITGGIPETLPRLLAAIKPHMVLHDDRMAA